MWPQRSLSEATLVTMPVTCDCGQTIPAGDVNVDQGVALCRACGKVLKAFPGPDSQEQAKAIVLAAGQPPAGCDVAERDGWAVLSARLLGPMSFIVLFVAVAWNALILHILPRMWTGGQSPGDTLFLLLFPLAGAGAILYALVHLFGRYEVRLKGDRGESWIGLGRVGWTRRFDASRVTAVRFEEREINTKDGRRIERFITLDLGDPRRGWCTFSLAKHLPEQRRLWLGGALKKLLGLPGSGLCVDRG